PPGQGFFSTTLTCIPHLARCAAAAMPPIPAPMMMTDGAFILSLLALVSSRQCPRVSVLAAECGALRSRPRGARIPGECMLDTPGEANTPRAQWHRGRRQSGPYTHTPPDDSACFSPAADRSRPA